MRNNLVASREHAALLGACAPCLAQRRRAPCCVPTGAQALTARARAAGGRSGDGAQLVGCVNVCTPLPRRLGSRAAAHAGCKCRAAPRGSCCESAATSTALQRSWTT